MPGSTPRWSRSEHRAELLRLYREVDELVEGWSCACSRAGVGGSPEAQCCHFAVTGREPYPTTVELEEVRHAAQAAPAVRRDPKLLPLVELRACPLLSSEGRCRIYASRPFGCRTFFCDHAEGPSGPGQKLPRAAIAAVGRRIADLSGRFAPRDPGPRSLVKALAGRGKPL